MSCEFQPWCGVPPLMDDIKKPSRKQTQKISNNNQKDNERERDKTQVYQDALDLEKIWAEEDWDCNDDDGDNQNRVENEVKDVTIEENSTSLMNGEKAVVSVCEDEDISTNVSSPLNDNTASPFSPSSNDLPQKQIIETEVVTDDEGYEQPRPNSSEHGIENGFYDVSGIWYPSSKVFF